MISVRNLTVRFGAVTALDDVSIDVQSDTIHALQERTGPEKVRCSRLSAKLRPSRRRAAYAVHERRTADPKGYAGPVYPGDLQKCRKPRLCIGDWTIHW